MARKNRIRYIDYMKAFGILLVVLGHANFANEAVKPWIYSFHMPLFFFASGLLMRNRPARNAREFFDGILHRFCKLMVPFFLWAVIYARLNFLSMAKILYGSHFMLKSAKSLTSLWFLPVLFLSDSLFQLIKFVGRKLLNLVAKLVAAILCFAITFLLPPLKYGYPWGADITFAALGFMILGNVCFPLIEKVRSGTNRRLTVAGEVAVLIIAMLGTVLLYRYNLPNDNCVNISESVYGNYGLFLLVAFLGIIMVTTLCVLLGNCSSEMRFLSVAGENTLCILATHKLLITLFRAVLTRLHAPSWLALIVIGVGVTAISCVIGVILQSWFPALTGGWTIPGRNKRQ